MGVLSTPGYRMPCAGRGRELPHAGHRQLWHQWEQHCSLSGIPEAPTLTYLRKSCSHREEIRCEETGKEKWREQEGAVSGDTVVDALCEECAPCQSRDYWGTMAVDNPLWGRNALEGMRPSLKVLGGMKYNTHQKQWEMNLGKWQWKMFPKCLFNYVVSQYLI